MPVMTGSTSRLQLIAAYATVYIVWGSTYYFIQKAVDEFPAAILGATRFLLSGIIMLGWVALKKEQIFHRVTIIRAAISGMLLLFFGNGIVIYIEQHIPSGIVAIVVCATPIWFVLFDHKAWKVNLKSPLVILGTLSGFLGVVLLVNGNITHRVAGTDVAMSDILLLLLAPALWSAGSIYSKYYPGKSSVSVTAAWQMLIAGLLFLLVAINHNKSYEFNPAAISTEGWFALFYLVIFGSIIGYSAYVWLLQVEPTARASTYAYVNPVVAVLMGVLFAGEDIGLNQLLGFGIILTSVLLINLQKYRSGPAN
jgi:drug/metabolite transporter (DMT)-like permease